MDITKVSNVSVNDVAESEDISDNNQSPNISEIKIEETEISDNNINTQKIKKKRKQKKGKDTIFKCSACDNVLNSRFQLYYHKLTRHAGEDNTVKCQFCSFKNIFKSRVFLHIKKEHQQIIKSLRSEAKSKMESRTTIEVTTSTSSVPKHVPIQPEKGNSSTIQKIAKISTSNSKEQMQQTKKESSDDEFIKDLLNMTKIPKEKNPKSNCGRQCDKCGKIYVHYNSLLSHQKKHLTEVEKYSCSYCEKKFTQSYELQKHINNLHGLETKINCAKCSFTAPTEIELKTHIDQCNSKRLFKCDKCSKCFTSKQSMRLHSKTHSNFKCDICSESFPYKHMKQHKRVHTTKINCAKCSFTAATEIELKIHFDQCNSKRPFKCDKCSKCFTTKQAMRRHSQRHKNIKCDICSESFPYKHLKRHERVHARHKQTCAYCGKLINNMAQHKEECLGRNKNCQIAN